MTVAAIRCLLDHFGPCQEGAAKLRAWVIDEEAAYRGIGVHPSQKKFSVVAMTELGSDKVAYFMMTGHAFGWSAAVCTYNRLARLKEEVLRKIFWLPCFADDDGFFGIETEETIAVAEQVAPSAHELLGFLYGDHKAKASPNVDILGVAY